MRGFNHQVTNAERLTILNINVLKHYKQQRINI